MTPDDLERRALALHETGPGKLEVRPTVPLETREDLALAYTPGVAAVCCAIAADPAAAYRYTVKGNMVAIVTDGTAVLGLGDIGALAALPVMEGKAALFKAFAGIDAFPLCFSGHEADFADRIRSIAPAFGGINLEDIAAPRCFAVEEALQDCGIPVMHDDQHGTAIVVLAALLNACRATGRRFEDQTIAIVGAGAAGYACARLLKCIGYEEGYCRPVRDIVVCDREGIIHHGRHGLYANKYKYILAVETNRTHRTGGIADALRGADMVIGVSGPGVITAEMVRTMNPDPIVFAMANPTPEIWPNDALAAGAAVVATGRSDFPNQVNNVLAFPGVFRGALDARAPRITDAMKIAAAHALADCVHDPSPDLILPSPLDRSVAPAVAAAVRKAALRAGAEMEGA
ncbi:MAG: NADP-dependent malic enzyme [Methanospirillum sp.]